MMMRLSSLTKFASNVARSGGSSIITKQQQLKNHINNIRLLSAVVPSTIDTTTTTVSFPDYVLRAPTTDVSTLENGLRIASETIIGSETATVGVWIDAGSRYETSSNNGVAHFLEHLTFKGTSSRSQQQLEIEIENMGGHLNAYTSREQTVYFAKIFKNDIRQALDILSDILLHSKLDEHAIEREREVILREMMEVNKQHEELVLDHLHATAFQGTGLGRTILGPTHNIQSLTRSDLVDYIQQHYTAPRMVIAGAGAIQHDELCHMAAEYFGNLPTKPPPKGGTSTSTTTDNNAIIDIASDPAIFTGSDYRVKFNSDDTAHIAIAFESASWTSEYAFPLMLMQVILGSYDRTAGLGKSYASKLCSDIAADNLAHSVSCFNTCYKDTGLFGIYMVGESIKLDDLSWTVMNNIMRLVHTVTVDEVERAKLNLKSIMLMNLDGHSNIAEDIGRQILTYGRRMTIAEIFLRIDSVTVADIKATSAKVINDQDHALAAVGGIHELPDYNWFRRHSYWVRY